MTETEVMVKAGEMEDMKVGLRRSLRKIRIRVSRFWGLFKQSRMGLIGLTLLVAFVAIGLFAPYIAPYTPQEFFVGTSLEPPSFQHLLGCDEIGRDIFSLLVYGTRISLVVGLLASLGTVCIGTLVGLVSGYIGGRVDEVLMRVTDVILMLPGIPLLIVFAAMLGASLMNIIFILVILSWPATARVIRAQVLSLKERPFVEAARAIGASDRHVIFHHILPNVTPLVFTYMILNIPVAIVTEASLSFLGLGDVNAASWGMMLNFAFNAGAIDVWYYIIPPGALITVLAFTFALIGHAMDEIINPRLRQR
ncbi:MAG: ABC transporter permease [Candidatus Hodarchaeota archaeon]